MLLWSYLPWFIITRYQTIPANRNSTLALQLHIICVVAGESVRLLTDCNDLLHPARALAPSSRTWYREHYADIIIKPLVVFRMAGFKNPNPT